MRRSRLRFIAIALFIVFQAVGLIGIFSAEYRELTLDQTAGNLVLTLAFVLVFHNDFQTKNIIWMLFVALGGWGVEWLGVHTGFPFGNYYYGDTLGIKLDGIPLVMGVNWLLLCYLSVEVSQYYPLSNFWRAILSAFHLVLLDLIIEPVAMGLDFWQWSANQVPIVNYLAWFVLALLFNGLRIKFIGFSKNLIALPLFLYLTVFFLILLLFII